MSTKNMNKFILNPKHHIKHFLKWKSMNNLWLY